MSVEILFETHAVSVDNERGIATGWRDGQLSTDGRRLAVELGRRHLSRPPAAVHASDLGRAVETAEIAFGTTDVPLHFDARLRECDYGDMTGMPVAKLDRERALHVTQPFPGGESYADVVVRVRSFLEEIAASDGRTLLLIGHSATRFSLDHLLADQDLATVVWAPFDWKPGWRYRLVPAGQDGV